MAKKKYYAVKRGKTPGIYLDWAICKEQVDGYPGAMYKGFATEEEARRYLDGATTEVSGPSPGEALAYVDGSYDVETGAYSCGVVFFYEGEEIRLSKKGEDTELAQMRNVAGELMGARMAMEEAVKRGASLLTIFHDYQGIASWCTGDWRANKEGTKAYKAYFDSLTGQLRIRFQKVKGHSGDTYNDLADALARAVLFGETQA